MSFESSRNRWVRPVSVGLPHAPANGWIFDRMVGALESGLAEGFQIRRELPAAYDSDVFHWFDPTVDYTPGGPYVISSHGVEATLGLIAAEDYTRRMRGACFVGAVSSAERERLLDRGVDKALVGVIQCGVDQDLFGIRERAASRRLRIGFVGRRYLRRFGGEVSRPKGEDRLHEILKRIATLPVEMIFLGQGAEFEVELCRELGIPFSYLKAGTDIVHADYPAVYNEMDLLLITSRSEGGPATFFEAMACGVPVLSTRVGLVGEFVSEGVNGFVFDGRDPATAVRRIEACIDTPSLFGNREIIRNSVAFASWEQYAREWGEIYLRGARTRQGAHDALQWLGANSDRWIDFNVPLAAPGLRHALRDRYSLVAQHLEGGTVVDLCPGVGCGARLLRVAADEVIGIQRDAAALAYAQREYAGDGVFFARSSVGTEGISNGRADAVTILDSGQGPSLDRELIEESTRMLRRGGLLAVAIPNRRTEWVERQRKKLDREFDEVAAYAQNSGFIPSPSNRGQVRRCEPETKVNRGTAEHLVLICRRR